MSWIKAIESISNRKMKNLQGMMGLDIYLSTLKREELEEIGRTFQTSNRSRSPLLSWDVYVNHYQKMVSGIEHRIEIDQLAKAADHIGCVTDFGFVGSKNYDALILTDAEQTILWVSDGFTEMTGYGRKYAQGKKPHFLQGANTSLESKSRIRQLLKKEVPFNESVVNYRKDATEYECEVSIFPLKNSMGNTNAFLALEKKIS